MTKENVKSNLIQFIKFGIVGVINTFGSYLINIGVLLLLKPLHWSKDYVVANLVAFVLSVLWSYALNSKFVFKVEEGRTRNPYKALLKTYASYAFTGILLNNVMSYIWIEKFGISKYIAPLLNLIVSVPVNFLMNKLWAFRTVETENTDLEEAK